MRVSIQLFAILTILSVLSCAQEATEVKSAETIVKEPERSLVTANPVVEPAQVATPPASAPATSDQTQATAVAPAAVAPVEVPPVVAVPPAATTEQVAPFIIARPEAVAPVEAAKADDAAKPADTPNLQVAGN